MIKKDFPKNISIIKTTFKGKNRKLILIFGEKLKNIKTYIKNKKVFIITDENVYKLYKENFPDGEVFITNTGENAKTIETIKNIYYRLIEKEFDRSSFIVAIGGGVVCDIAGFTASTYMRGIEFCFVPTSLLAQTDASIGGKNAVNLNKYKNMIGTFNQPSFIIYDFEILKTLPKQEIISGYAEIIKHALIANPTLFEYLEKNHKKALSLESSVMKKILFDSVKVKLDIVEKDEFEKGERRKLNFGHTFGHAIEKISSISHGKAVGLGMIIALRISKRMGMLSEKTYKRILVLIKNYGLPTLLKINSKLLLDKIRMDKKREGKFINFVLLDDIGKSIVKKVKLTDFERFKDVLY